METDDLLEYARARFDHETQRRVLKEKYQARMLFAHAGGMWQAGPELLTVLSTCDTENMVLLDLYENPIMVVRADLLDQARQRWQEQMTAWHQEWQQLKKQR